MSTRRGNFEVMVRGLFTNRSLVNRLAPQDGPGGMADAARRAEAAGAAACLVAGERYGAGSSRDWGAKGPALLGVRAVLAASFERIHRSNLVGMGILPVELPQAWHPDRLAWTPGDRIALSLPAGIGPRGEVGLELLRADGSRLAARGRLMCDTAAELDILAAGGLIPLILSRTLDGAARELQTETTE